MKQNISIVGGGISGLYLAYLLSQNADIIIHLYEKKSSFGGRIRTEYNKNGTILYETGPWRIPKHHKNMIKLIKEFNLTLESIQQPIKYHNIEKVNTNKETGTTETTEYQNIILNSTIENGNNAMIKSGYDFLYQRANTTRSYTSENETEFFVVKEGFSKLIELLVEKIKQQKNVKLYNEHIIDKIEWKNKKYNLNTKIRIDSKTFVSKIFNTEILVLAIPPHEIEKFSLSLFPNTSMVQSLPLMHIMAKTNNSNFLSKQFKMICNSPISQIVQSCYQNEWFQISYSAGRFANYFQNLVISSKKKLQDYVKKEFYKIFPKVKVHEIKSYYWRNAVHYWNPNLKSNENNFMKRCIYPHPQKYKNLYWIGESISTTQGWMEGAIETSIYLYNSISKEQKLLKTKPKEYVIYDGRIINVEKWKHQHPGGKNVIQNHLYEDVTQLWNMYHDVKVSKFLTMLEHR
jgi:cytochrome b involved in lipid metabolism